jgi:uncharacterized protein (TIGR00730 family)
VNNICVYCGSSPGADPRFTDAAVACGTRLAEAGLTLVYGGGRMGLMGAVADAALAGGARVVGVITQGLVDREIAHRGLSELHVVPSMHERKLKMAELSDAFLCLPGGPGTFEEIFEQWTWSLLGIHAKPCGFVNVGGYFDRMRGTIQHMADSGFIAQVYVDALTYAESTDAALEAFRGYVPPPPKWSGAQP